MAECKQINEGLNYKDMVGMLKPTLYIDEFSSKIAEDDEIVVLSFYVKNDRVCNDLINWFEKGYQYILDADRSPGEVSPNRYLVFVEIERRTRLIDQIKELIEDLETLTEWRLNNWVITHDGQDTKYDPEVLKDMIDLSPHVYRLNHEKELNEMRTAANLPTKSTLKGKDPELDIIRMQAGIL